MSTLRLFAPRAGVRELLSVVKAIRLKKDKSSGLINAVKSVARLAANVLLNPAVSRASCVAVASIEVEPPKLMTTLFSNSLSRVVLALNSVWVVELLV